MSRPDRDTRIDTIDRTLPLVPQGVVGIRTYHDTYINAQMDQGARANETHLHRWEKWDKFVQFQTGLVVFMSWQGSEYSCLRATSDGNCHADGNIHLHGGCYWTQINNPDGTVSFRSTFGNYLTAEPPNHSGPRQVLADRDHIDIWQKFLIELTEPPIRTNHDCYYPTPTPISI